MANPPPYHWRAGRGYLPPVAEEEPAQATDSGFYAPHPFMPGPPGYFSPAPGSAYGPPFSYPVGPPPGLPFPPQYTSFHVGPDPGGFYTAPPPCFFPWGGPPPPLQIEEKEVDATDSEDSDDEKDHPTSKPPGTKLPGGLRGGSGMLYTGKPCQLAIINSSHVKLEELIGTKASKKIKFSLFTIQDNSSVAELLEAIGGNEDSSITQVWEKGNGLWRKGSAMRSSEKRLSEFGWSEAGSKYKPQVWFYFKEKDKKK